MPSSSITASAAARARGCTSRQDIFDDVVGGVADHAKGIKLGHGFDPDTHMGPLVSQEQLNRVCSYLEAGLSEGAEAVVGGKRRDGLGYFVEPTVMVKTNPNMKVVREEIFGPGRRVPTPFKR